MNSKKIKTQVLMFFRFKRKYRYIATEVGYYNADVMVSNGKQIIEIEVKTSFNDLKNDFKKKKHLFYMNPESKSKLKPNKFYFAIPKKLEEKTIKLLKDSPYGIIIVEPIKSKRKNGCTIITKASLLTKEYSNNLEHRIIMRMGSELIRTRINKYLKLNKGRKNDSIN